MKSIRSIITIAAAISFMVGLVNINIPSAVADEIEYAPINQPGPELDTPESELDAALNCPTNIEQTIVPAVILFPGTRLSTGANFGWNWVPALTAAGIPVCTVELDDRGMSDVQRSVENAVYAIREVYDLTGLPVRIVGYSQGGIVPRWALRFWPDLRPMVSELVTLAGVHNGTTSTDPLCLVGCAPALFQQRPGTQFTEALNSLATTYPGIEITSIYTRYDELATPNFNGEASTLAGATNIALQDICPLNVSEHLTIGTTDPVAYALALDALTHVGTADPNRLPGNICSKVVLPGINLLTMPLHLAAIAVEVADSLLTEPKVYSEPPLRCYVTASCED